MIIMTVETLCQIAIYTTDSYNYNHNDVLLSACELSSYFYRNLSIVWMELLSFIHASLFFLPMGHMHEGCI